jgi:RNA polymerase sigma-70 factor (ECF subfamily)
MADLSLETLELHGLLARWREGDRGAADELCRRVGRRFELLAHKMIGRFPNLRPLVDTGDVLQLALMRLLKTLSRIRPESTRDFYNLAAVHLRRELLDLTRRAAARPDLRHRHGQSDDASEGALGQLAGAAVDGQDLDRWCRFHEAVEALPTHEHEVIGLAFYHGWTQQQMAELFEVDVRTIRRWWRSACAHLHEALGGEVPGLVEGD